MATVNQDGPSLPLTDAEKAAVSGEIWARFKDMVYVAGEVKCHDILEGYWHDFWVRPATETISVSFTLECIVGDLWQIVGRLRRA